MKKVFGDIQAIAHLWANQHQDEARTPSHNFYFNGRVIYSYGGHFPIARIMEDGVVMFTTNTYSNTTAKHINAAWSACSWRTRILCANITTSGDKEQFSHDQNFIDWSRRIEEELKHLKRARKPEKYFSTIDNYRNQIHEYCEYFEVATSPELTTLLEVTNFEEYSQFNAERVERVAKYNAERIKAGKIAYTKNVSKWITRELERLYSVNGYDFLRLSKDKTRVETTQGVQIPLETAKIFHKLVKTNKLKVGDKILGYEVLTVGTKIKIGCHNFRKTYLVKFGNSLPRTKKKKI